MEYDRYTLNRDKKNPTSDVMLFKKYVNWILQVLEVKTDPWKNDAMVKLYFANLVAEKFWILMEHIFILQS